MGLFGLFKKKEKVVVPEESRADKAISRDEKKYYQEDSYYTEKAFEGTMFERDVITFEQRKKTAIPSERGLYPAEILLLHYCSLGGYPGPKNGYPGFWWFEYGIRDVGAALKAMESRGFIAMGTVKASVKSLTIPKLKELLNAHGLPVSGKKADLVTRVQDNISEEELLSTGLQPKYVLTAEGNAELFDNAYVPYMHSAHNKTTEDDQFGVPFNVWVINKLLGSGSKVGWEKVVQEQEQKMQAYTNQHNTEFMAWLKGHDPEGYHKLKTQDDQLELINNAKNKYKEDKNLTVYIAFWENLWNTQGLTFEGSTWHFELPDLYIKAKRYDDALKFLNRLKKSKPYYADKADSYIQRIQGLIQKSK